MNCYTELPRRGNARKIWLALTELGIVELHYNPNLWGKGKQDGWGTWACSIRGREIGMFCGIQNGRVYVEQMAAPYNRRFVDD